MSGRLLATAAEQAEVVRLRAAGYSHRAIAAAVFGSEGLKGRVERILRRRVEGSEEPDALADVLRAEPAELDARLETLAGKLVGEERLARTRRLVEGHKRRHEEQLEQGKPVRASELYAITRLELLLDNLERFERLRKLTREP
jgi:hypothetical protein